MPQGKTNCMYDWGYFLDFIYDELFIIFHLYKIMKSRGADSFSSQSHQWS